MNTRKTRLVQAVTLVLALIFLCTGCLVHELNAGDYHRYYVSGLSHLEAENYEAAKKSFSTTIYYAQAGFLGPAANAAAWYNYAIATGHLGDFQQAEDSFKKAQAFDEKTEGKNGPLASMRWFELARLYQAWGRNPDAIEAYEKAIPLAENHGVIESDPIGYAAVLSDYASVLKESGYQQKAESVQAGVKKMEDANPGVQPKFKIHYYPAK